MKVQNFQNPKLFKNQILKLEVCLQISTISNLNGQLSLDKLKTEVQISFQFNWVFTPLDFYQLLFFLKTIA